MATERLSYLSNKEEIEYAHLEQLSRGVPQLPPGTVLLSVAKLLVPPCNISFKLGTVSVFIEIKTSFHSTAIWCSEDCGALAEVAVVRVVQRILDEIPHQHPHSVWRFSVRLKVTRRQHRVLEIFRVDIGRESDVWIIVNFVLVFRRGLVVPCQSR